MLSSNGTLQTNVGSEAPIARPKNENSLLVRLLPEEVNREWEFYGPTIRKALPPLLSVSSVMSNNLLRAILEEEASVWNLYDNVTPDNEGDLVAVVVTTIWLDPISGARNLLIYSLTSFKPLFPRFWKKNIETLIAYARGIRCSAIIAYSDIPQLADFLERLGWDASFSLLNLKI